MILEQHSQKADQNTAIAQLLGNRFKYNIRVVTSQSAHVQHHSIIIVNLLQYTAEHISPPKYLIFGSQYTVSKSHPANSISPSSHLSIPLAKINNVSNNSVFFVDTCLPFLSRYLSRIQHTVRLKGSY